MVRTGQGGVLASLLIAGMMIVGTMIVGVPTTAKADIAFARYHLMLLAQPSSVLWRRRFGKASHESRYFRDSLQRAGRRPHACVRYRALTNAEAPSRYRAAAASAVAVCGFSSPQDVSPYP